MLYVTEIVVKRVCQFGICCCGLCGEEVHSYILYRLTTEEEEEVQRRRSTTYYYKSTQVGVVVVVSYYYNTSTVE